MDQENSVKDLKKILNFFLIGSHSDFCLLLGTRIVYYTMRDNFLMTSVMFVAQAEIENCNHTSQKNLPKVAYTILHVEVVELMQAAFILLACKTRNCSYVLSPSTILSYRLIHIVVN